MGDRFGFKDFLTLMKEAGSLEELSKTVNALYYGRTSLANAESQFKRMYVERQSEAQSQHPRSQSVVSGMDELQERRWSGSIDIDTLQAKVLQAGVRNDSDLPSQNKIRHIERSSTNTSP